ncbi:fungal-specific transcription factor domain-containing protein [Aspergillus avenaceus]|uniref:Fungal-specific transcription factor domain-containing protein n=1 Tax=Aspergillus avenaceus TaxID=36643 RepID=A0A5N6U894_ASPAV|nr:fungal-specific transcription factor domain-containing protein [Aspergillus avenaceus]
MVRRYNVSRSCLRCHQRKVRCDKSNPCAACIRSNVPCRYPGLEKVKRRPPTVSLSEVASRLARLERAVSAIVGEDNAGTRISSTTAGSTGDRVASGQSARPVAHVSREGFLVTSGPSTRYINESFLSHVLDKEKELQSAIESQNAGDSSNSSTPLRAEGLFLNPRHTPSDVVDLYPSRWEAIQLWQIYLSNVDPVMRVLHIPSFQPKVFNAINAPDDVPPDLGALLFSIYFAAVTSLLSINDADFLGDKKHAALQKYQRGMEVSLYNSSFLDSPTIPSLQAMTIYVRCRRFHSSGRSNWALNGLTIYAAQSIGLHRDGSHFNLPILECELRRRLWWHIMTADKRGAEDHGLVGGFETVADTHLPLNIDDSDLDPQTQVLPPPKEKWTEMTMFLITTEASQVFARMHRPSTEQHRGKDGHKQSRKIVAEFDTSLHGRYLQHCDTNIPIQKATYLLGRILLAKSKALLYIQSLTGLSSEKYADHVNEETLSYTCEGLECGSQMLTDEILKSFRWLSSTFTQYHLLTYALWHLCVCPGAPGADRAWRAIGMAFELTERNSTWRDSDPHWAVLCRLRQKALSTRKSYRAANPPADPVDTEVDLQDAWQGDMIEDDTLLPWDIDSLAFFDWAALTPTA